MVAELVPEIITRFVHLVNRLRIFRIITYRRAADVCWYVMISIMKLLLHILVNYVRVAPLVRLWLRIACHVREQLI